MAVVPSGSPAWARTVQIADYGGATDKRNYLDRKGIDALTDVNAEQFARLTADLAAATRTAPFAVLTVRVFASGPPKVDHVHMATGIRLSSYDGDAPPTGYPGVVKNGDGDFTVTFAASYVDAYGVSAPFSITHVIPQAIGTVVRRAVASLPTATSVRVKMFEADDSPVVSGADGERCSLMVF